MKKKVLIPTLLLGTTLFLGKAQAQNSSVSGETNTFPNPFGGNITNITQILNPLIDLIINIGGIIVVFFIILAGFKMVLAQGDPGKINEAKKMLLWTIVGGLILLGSKVLAEVVRSTVQQIGS